MDELSKGISIVKTMKRIMHSIKHSTNQHYRDMNITGPQGMLMGILIHHGDMKISDLSEKLGLSNSTVSGIIDRLEIQGLVSRTRSQDDRRVVYVKITEDSKKRAQQHFEDFERKIGDLINEATDQELDKILEGLSILENILNRHNDSLKL